MPERYAGQPFTIENILDTLEAALTSQPSEDARIIWMSLRGRIHGRKYLPRFLPQTTFRRLRGVAHLSPLEAPDALADACNALLHELGCRLRRIASDPEPVARLGYALRGFNDYSPA